MNAENFRKQNGVLISSGMLPDTDFEKLYLAVRKKEQRVYTNNELIKLPKISRSHQHYKEWLVRKSSSGKLLSYLKRKNKPLQILEVGCGNGWLSNKFAEITQTDVTGLDINLTELQQAANVFTKNNLKFVYGDLRKNILQSMQFDIIVFAASVPYFSSLKEIMLIALQHLTPGGEIHIIDSFFYKETDVAGVKHKCKTYYENMGISEMAEYFFHHSLNDLKGFNYAIMPQNSFLQKLYFTKSIFPWLCIRHS